MERSVLITRQKTNLLDILSRVISIRSRLATTISDQVVLEKERKEAIKDLYSISKSGNCQALE